MLVLPPQQRIFPFSKSAHVLSEPAATSVAGIVSENVSATMLEVSPEKSPRKPEPEAASTPLTLGPTQGMSKQDKKQKQTKIQYKNQLVRVSC
jgi:hypothetical protein